MYMYIYVYEHEHKYIYIHIDVHFLVLLIAHCLSNAGALDLKQANGLGNSWDP